MEDRASYLFEKYVNRQATVAERDELFSLLRSDSNDPHILSLIDQYYAGFTPQDNPFSETTEAAMLRTIFESDGTLPQIKPLWPRIAAAASLVIGLSIGAYVFVHQKQQADQEVRFVQDIAPGRNQATLTLANGQKIVLTKTLNGKLAQQGNMQIQVNDGKAITYSANAAENHLPAQLAYNTLSTARGEQSPYPLVLPDGTRVWLNSASTLKFPASFANLSERRVTLSGEAYFEVAHNSGVPFRVITGRQIVEDIGTAFNINSYEPAIKTTLLEGSVRINNTHMLIPGQQASLLNDVYTVEKADTEEVIAWKNGYFRFNNQSLRNVMDKLALWYDIDVSYAGKIPAVGFYGTISRNKNISEVLTMLEQTKGVHFKIDGRRVTVLE